MAIKLNTVESTQDHLSVGWIGAGKMGAPMIRNLLAQGIGITVTDPDAGVTAALVQQGATLGIDAAAHVERNIVFSTLPNDAVLRSVVVGTETTPGLATILRPGAIFVEMSTVSPECSTEIATALSNNGIKYLRAPLSGSTALAEKAALTILASGNKTAWDTVEPYLAHLSVRHFYLGEGEEARYMKLVLNTLVGATAAIMAEALALGESGGLSRSAIMEVVGESAVASPLLKYKTEAIVEDDYSPAFSVGQMIKDFSLINDAARAHGVPQHITAMILEQYRSAAAAGLNDQDFFALIKWRGGLPYA